MSRKNKIHGVDSVAMASCVPNQRLKFTRTVISTLIRKCHLGVSARLSFPPSLITYRIIDALVDARRTAALPNG